MMIGNYLHFHVARMFDVFFEVDGAVPERGLRFRLRLLERTLERQIVRRTSRYGESHVGHRVACDRRSRGLVGIVRLLRVHPRGLEGAGPAKVGRMLDLVPAIAMHAVRLA